MAGERVHELRVVGAGLEEEEHALVRVAVRVRVRVRVKGER